jgi:hypothetical protein
MRPVVPAMVRPRLRVRGCRRKHDRIAVLLVRRSGAVREHGESGGKSEREHHDEPLYGSKPAQRGIARDGMDSPLV